VGVHRAIDGDLNNTATATGYDVQGLPHTAMDTAAVTQIEANPCVVCPEIYDFKASIKNSNVGVKLDSKCRKNFAYKFVESNNLAGYLVVSCSECSCIPETASMGTLYVYRQSDKTKTLYKVPADLVFADVFVKGLNAQCDPLVGTDAEGLLWVNPDFWYESFIMNDFFGTYDAGVTTFIATGFGKAVTTKDATVLLPGDCEPTLIPGCTTLDSLSGSIVGAMNFSSVCNEPYQLICVGGIEFADEVVSTVNSVTSGTWSIKRSTDKKIVACAPSTIEANILKKMKGYRLQPTQPALTNR
jgi:hypothetical protein